MNRSTESLVKKMKISASNYRHSRLNLTRIFVCLVLALIAFTGSQWETQIPLVSGILFLGGCFLVGIATIGRLWCSLYIAGRKSTVLVVDGPYSLCRHPLYFFSLLGGMGVGMASETLTITALIILAFVAYYPFVIRYEENKMRTLHGQMYERYCQKTPRFWPRWSHLTEPEEYLIYPKIFRKHLLGNVGFILLIGFLELLEMFKELQILPVFATLY